MRLIPGAHSAAHRGADIRCHRSSGRERDDESGPDYFRSVSSTENGDVPAAIQSQVPTIRTVQKIVEVLSQLQSLIER